MNAPPEQQTDDPVPGSVRARAVGLPDRYRVLRLLGEGGFGCVLLADDRELRRKVAIKILDVRRDQEAEERFLREARATSRVLHRSVVTVHDVGVTGDGRHFIVYEYLPGVDLEKVLERRRRVPEAEVVRWGAELARALAAVHEAGFVHRDLKPANLLIRDSGDPVVLDLGIAHSMNSGRQLTGENRVLGTVGYMAPEVMAGAPPSPASDQYGLAAVLYELLYGEPVQPTGSVEDCLGWAREPTPPGVPDGFRGRLPGVEVALLRALDLDPARRHPDLDGFAGALEAGLETRRDRVEEGDDEEASEDATVLELPGKPGQGRRRRVRRSPGVRRRVGAPGAGSRKARLAGALLVLAMAVLGWYLGTSGFGRAARGEPADANSGAPASATAPPAAGGGLSPALRERLREAEERMRSSKEVLAGFHSPEEAWVSTARPSPEGWFRHVQGAFPGVFDPQFEIELVQLLEAERRWLDALCDWQEALPAGESVFFRPPVREVFVEVLLGLPLHLLEDMQQVHGSRFSLYFLSLKGGRSHGHEPEPAREWRELVHALTGDLARWPRPRPDALLALEGLYRAAADETLARREVLERIHLRLRRDPDSSWAYWLERALVQLVYGDQPGRQGRCERMVTLHRQVFPRLVRPQVPYSRAERADLLRRHAAEMVRTLGYCSPLLDERDWLSFDEVLATLAASGGTAPRRLEEAYQHASELITTQELFSAEDPAREEALRRLMQRLEAARGVGQVAPQGAAEARPSQRGSP